MRDEILVERAARWRIGVRGVGRRVVAHEASSCACALNTRAQLLELGGTLIARSWRRSPCSSESGKRERAVQLERSMCEAPVVEILSCTEHELLADER